MSVITAPTTNARQRPGAGGPDTAGPPAVAPGGGGDAHARWVRPALLLLLAVTAAAYLWDLSASGYANSFYAAAVQAGTKSWKAFFFGSIDSSNYITVDKPPGSLWLMELSGRLFGFSSWSMLAPQALEGVAAVAVLYATVKRWFGSWAGLLAGAILAATPVAALMFRFNNPDALLTLLLVGSAYALTRAVEKGSSRWMIATGSLVGFAFLAKMLQAFTVLPAFFFVYLLAAPLSLRSRIKQLALGGAAIAVSAGWWVAIVALWPASSRPMIDGSSSNSIINLILGYNGLGRLYSSGSGGGGGANFSGATGVLRLFNTVMGGQASWLIPAAALAAVAGVAWRGRAPRTDRTRAALLMWGGWLLVTGAVFSFGQGVIHTYYTVALAPAIAALFAVGIQMVWRNRHHLAARALGALGVAGTAVWAAVLLDRTPSYHPWLRTAILVGGLLSAAGMLAAPLAGRMGRRVAVTAAGVGLVACLAGPTAYAVTTIGTAHTGSIPSAGPASAGGGFGGAAGGPGGRTGSFQRPTGTSGGFPTPPSGAAASGTSGGTPPSGSFPGGSSGSASTAGGSSSSATSSSTGGAPGSARTGAPTGGGAGGAAQLSTAEVTALRANASSYKWVAATFGSQTAASIELATGEPVMAIGGFSGTGGNISLATFESYVAKGYIHYFIASGNGGGGPQGSSNSNSDSAITAWVASHYSTVTIGGQTVYDLTAATK